MAGISRAWRALGLSMAAGAVYDVTFAVAILAFTRPAAALLSLSVPDDTVYLRLNGVFLLLLAGLYSLAAWDPIRYQGVAAVAAVGRAAGFLYLAGAWLGGRPRAFLALAIGDLALASAHAALLVLARRSEPVANR